MATTFHGNNMEKKYGNIVEVGVKKREKILQN